MRIRKHAKISPLVYATAAHKTAAILQPHVCQLNQSPWDVMSFSPPSTPHPPPPPSQVDRNDVSAGNGSSRNPISAFEREMNAWLQPEYPNNPARKITTPAAAVAPAAVSAVAPAAVSAVAPAAAVAPVAAEKEEDKMEVEPPPKKKEEIILCCKTDGKNWQCKNEAAKGNSLCDHHISQMKSYSHNNATHNTTKKSGKQAAAAEAPPPAPRRSRPKKSPKSSSSANPYEFYYYSGFGPRWGKKRGETGGVGCGSNSNTNSMPENTRNEQEIEASVCDDEDSDYVEYEEDEEEEDVQENRDNNGGKKRVRKPIKARSLKSLM